MSENLFEDFLVDPQTCDACVVYWENLVFDVVKGVGQGGEWKRWISQTQPDGKPAERDGNPIFDGRSMDLERAFRIIQYQPGPEGAGIVAWIKEYEEEYVDLPRCELVLNIGLSVETARIARVVLRKWMAPETSVAAMSSFISGLSEGMDTQ